VISDRRTGNAGPSQETLAFRKRAPVYLAVMECFVQRLAQDFMQAETESR
jgi:hypothetical protein